MQTAQLFLSPQFFPISPPGALAKMAATNASLPEEISDLVRDWELKADVADTHTIHTNLIFDASTGRQIPQNERWEHVKELGSGSFGVVNLEKCVSGQRAGASRAVKRIQLRPRPVEADFKVIYRELSTIIKFSHQKVSRKSDDWEKNIFSSLISL